MNEQCKFCIHSDVCAYREHYEDAMKLYKEARNECSKYPWFKCEIVCVKYRKAEDYFVKYRKAESEGAE